MEKIITPFLKKNEKKWFRLNDKYRKFSSETKEYLEKNPVYFSMTTSPIRLRKIGVALSLILHFPYIKEIHINLPVLYRNKESYNQKDIDFIQNLSDKIKIFRVKEDIGPLTKILPTIERLREKKINNIVISVDDDIFYPKEIFYELAYYSYKYPKCVFTGSGFNFNKFYPYLDEFYIKPPYKYMRGCYQVDLIEGFGCVAYRQKLFDINYVLKLNNLSIECKLSDDLTISYMLYKKNVAKFVIDNNYFHVEKLKFFSYGQLEDALHKGSGISRETQIIENANLLKYKKCLKKIIKISD
jgi:hypothetical protein